MMDKWSQLSPELLFLISDRLGVPDLLGFGAVCHSWHNVTSERRHLRMSCHQIPLLMFNKEQGEDKQSPCTAAKFYSLSEERLFSLKQPEKEVKCIGSGCGWLIITYERCELSLLNPITGQQIQLPHFSTFFDHFSTVRAQRGDFTKWILNRGGVRYREGDCSNFAACHFIRKAVLTSPPDRNGGDCMVFLMMTETLYKIGYARPGDKKWTVVSDRLVNLDVICHQVQIYTALLYGKFASWNFTGPSASSELKPTILINPNREDILPNPSLVSSPSGDLLHVSWKPGRSIVMKVHKVDFEQQILVKVISLGENAIFMLPNSSVCLSVIDLPHLQRDCIYFMDDYIEGFLLHGYGRGGMEPVIDHNDGVHRYGGIGIYNLKDGSIQFLKLGGPNLGSSRTTWFVPSLA